MLNDIQIKICESNVGRAMEAFALASIENEVLKNRVKKLIYFTAEDCVRSERENKEKGS